MKTGGYYEYGGDHISIQRGCENGCRYCYARFNACKRAKICTEFEWNMPIINQKLVDKKYSKRQGQPLMFPRNHDITDLNVSECVTVIKKLLDAGNQIVIVSKPRFNVIRLMAEALLDYQQQIIFRFTIGSTSNDVLKFWEPNAPLFQDRLASLQYCFDKGYKTSVSCEPYLDRQVHLLYETLISAVNESFWIGSMKNYNSRVDKKKISMGEWERFVRPMLAASSYGGIHGIYRLMNDMPLVKWKDSIRKIIKKGTI